MRAAISRRIRLHALILTDKIGVEIQTLLYVVNGPWGRRRPSSAAPGPEGCCGSLDAVSNKFMITIVSGLPRSGTSLMMQMLVAGGMAALSDGERRADADNPRGYFEWERIKQLPRDPNCIVEAEGKVVKVISRLLLSLPAGHDYRVLFVQRPMPEVLASQDEMLRRRGTYKEGADPVVIAAAFEKHLREVYAWLDATSYVQWLPVSYRDILSQPIEAAQRIVEFLEIHLNVEAMAIQADTSLYRNRAK